MTTGGLTNGGTITGGTTTGGTTTSAGGLTTFGIHLFYSGSFGFESTHSSHCPSNLYMY